MNSMTGFGARVVEFEDTRIEAEIKSWNHKGLDVGFKLSEALSSFEPALREMVAKRATRGKLFVSLRLRGVIAGTFRFNEELLTSVVTPFKEAAARFGITPSISLGDLLAIPGAIENVEKSDEVLRKHSIEALEGALAEWERSRQVEGQTLLAALKDQVDLLNRSTVTFEARNKTAAVDAKARTKARVLELIEASKASVDEKRLEMELALLAERCDVEEEIVRIRAHVESLLKLIESSRDGRGVGAELGFVLQELLRETNTIGSKSQDIEMVKAVISGKTAIDRMKELAANVM